MTTPLIRYQADLQRPEFHHDPAQENAIRNLERLYHEICRHQQQDSGFLVSVKEWLFGKNTHGVKGLYFWGGVGRGKTYLVDTFYECLPFNNKMRIHFHRFMHRVHQELNQLGDVKNPLTIIADKFAAETCIICFDEFFVSDIADAMLLGGLFERLLQRDVVLVATSNIIPSELYRNGLQRARFLPAIALIEQNCEVVNVDHGVDYRLRTLEQAEIYHSPLDEIADTNLQKYFKQLAVEPTSHDIALSVEGRDIDCRSECDGVAFFEFLALCDGPRSQTDYMELSRLYHSVLLANVECMGRENDDIARRFIAMVDEFYERNVKLIISAQAPIENLYGQGQLEFEFKRCISRLQEMQSHEYLARPHIP